MQKLVPSETRRAIRLWTTIPLCIVLFLSLCLVANPVTAADAALIHHEWTVDGVFREALVSAPTEARTKPTPVVFVFHGHGGSMQNVARTFCIHKLWPEVIVVYPQGLRTPGQLTDPEGRRPGWQRAVGDQGDRDLKFFDATLASLEQEYRVDSKRIYATGHSNGGAFCYLLWAARGDRFAAFAPSGAAAPRLLASLKPKPALHIAGKDDALVKFAWQQQTINAIRRLNRCGAGQTWENETGCTLYSSPIGASVVTLIHSGAHRFPAAAPAIIVKFFRQHSRPPEKGGS